MASLLQITQASILKMEKYAEYAGEYAALLRTGDGPRSEFDHVPRSPTEHKARTSVSEDLQNKTLLKGRRAGNQLAIDTGETSTDGFSES